MDTYLVVAIALLCEIYKHSFKSSSRTFFSNSTRPSQLPHLLHDQMEYAPAPLPSPDFFNPLMIATVGIIATVIILTLFHFILSRYCIDRNHPTTQPYDASDMAKGVDEKVLNSIPIQAYQHKQEETVLGMNQCECAVCLGEFEEGDPVRLLPNCQHVFHLDCIDNWFISHSNCPLCRSLIVGPSSPVQSIFVNTNGQDAARLLNESQVQGSIVISIDEDGTRSSSNLSLRHCSSLLLPVEKKRQPHLLLARFRRSMSDCSSSSLKMQLDHENEPPSSSTSSASKKVEHLQCSSGRRGSFRRLGTAPVMKNRSFPRLGLSQGHAASSVLPL